MEQRRWGMAELRFAVENRGKLTCEEIAARLGRRTEQVRKALHRWRDRMRAKGAEVPNLCFRWTAEEKAFVRAHRLTLSIQQMADALKKSYHQVKGYVTRLRNKARRGAPIPRKKRPLSEWIADHEKKIRSLHAEGHTDEEIARKIKGMVRTTVCAVRQRLGLPSNAHAPRQRAKIAAWAKENMQFRVANMLEAERLGWPGRTLGEARTLGALAQDGPMTRDELAGRLGIKWGSGNNSLAARVRRLQEAGLITNGDGRYRLAPGVTRQAADAEDCEDDE